MPAYLVDTVEVEGVSISCKKRNLLADDDDEGLGWFDFEAENSIAVSTGTLLWDASTALINLLKEPGSEVRELVRGRRVVEFGSGIGLAGLCCAAAGAHMLLSDLPSITEGILARNIEANVTASSQGEGSQQQGTCWPGARPVGAGSVVAASLDFCKPLGTQVKDGIDAREADVVLAIDIVWLKELVTPLAAAIAGILAHPQSPSQQSGSTQGASGQAAGPESTGVAAPAAAGAQGTLQGASQGEASASAVAAPGAGPGSRPKVGLLAFGERGIPGSSMFVMLEDVCKTFQAQGCTTQLLRRMVIDRAGEKMPVAVVKLTLDGSNSSSAKDS